MRLVQDSADDLVHSIQADVSTSQRGRIEQAEPLGLTGILILRNMLTPFRASINATSCGVDTITAPISSDVQ